VRKATGSIAWVIEVADSGRGMSARQAAALTETQCGTGLGLATVRTVIGAWGGTMRIRAQPGAGTTVILRLPHTTSSLGPSRPNLSGAPH